MTPTAEQVEPIAAWLRLSPSEAGHVSIGLSPRSSTISPAEEGVEACFNLGQSGRRASFREDRLGGFPSPIAAYDFDNRIGRRSNHRYGTTALSFPLCGSS